MTLAVKHRVQPYIRRKHLILSETIIAYKRGQMIEAREAYRLAAHKMPIPTPIIFKDLVKLEETLSGYAPRYRFITLAGQKREPVEITCKVCGSIIIVKSKKYKYCGSVSDKTGCAYKRHLERADEYYQKVKKRNRK